MERSPSSSSSSSSPQHSDPVLSPFGTSHISDYEALKAETTSFVHAALRGRPVKLLKQLNAAPWVEGLDATMKLSKDLSELHFDLGGDGQRGIIRLRDVNHLFSVPDDGAAPFPAQLLDAVDETDRPLLVRLCHSASSNALKSLYFIEHSTRSRVELMKGLSVLCARACRPPRELRGYGRIPVKFDDNQLNSVLAASKAKRQAEGAGGGDDDETASELTLPVSESP